MHYGLIAGHGTQDNPATPLDVLLRDHPLPTGDEEMDYAAYLTAWCKIIIVIVKEGRMLSNKIEIMVLDYLTAGARDAFSIKLQQ